ncbi:MAG: extracellular solute-binding protein [Planctomycetes bacterium]|nr:extracellular solute-binding protein [Planctomycetota bacterium]
MTTRRLAKLGAILAAGALALAGCAPGQPATTQDPAPAQTGGAAAPEGPKELTYVYFTDGPDEQATRDLIKQFEEANGATVNLEIVPYANLEQTLQARLAGSNAPDVARVAGLGPWLEDLADLSPAKADLDGKFIAGSDAFTHDADGNPIAVFSDLTMNGPLVNVDLFEKAGVSYPKLGEKWTWDEMVAAAKEVKEKAGTEYGIAIDISAHRLSTMFSQYGTTLFKGDGMEPNWDVAKGAAAIEQFVTLNNDEVMPKDVFLQAGSKYAAPADVFLAQQVPVYISGNWQVASLSQKADFTWAAAPNPCAERCGGFPGGKFMVAFKQGKNIPLAAEFIAFMNSAEAQTHMAIQANFLPTRNDLIEQGIEYTNRGDDMKVFLADVALTPDDTYPSNFSPVFGATGREVITQIGEVMQGGKTAQQASEAIDQIVKTNAAG